MGLTRATECDPALAHRLFYENKEVKWFRTIVVMDRRHGSREGRANCADQLDRLKVNPSSLTCI